MKELKEKILHQVLLISILFILIPMTLGIMRALETGRYYQIYYYFFIFAIYSIVYIFRLKINFIIKTHLIGITYFLLLVFQVYHLNFLAAIWGIVPLFLYPMLGFNKSALAYLITFISFLCLVAYGNIFGFLTTTTDLNLYLTQTSGSLIQLCSFFYIAILLYVSAKNLFGYYKNANSELANSESRLKNQIKKTPIPILLTTPDGTLYDYNEDAEDIFGTKEIDFRGSKIIDRYRNPEDRTKLLTLFEKDGFVKNMEIQLVGLDGEIKDVRISAIPFLDKEKGTMLLTVIYDVTVLKNYERDLEKYQKNLEALVNERTLQLEQSNERIQLINEEVWEKNFELEKTLKKLKETQSQLVQNEKMASLGSLTAGIAHEINNPLNFIHGGYLGLTQYFKEVESENQRKTDLFLKSIQTGVERAKEIVKGLNMFNRNNDAMDETCDLHTILDNSTTILHTQLKHTITLQKEYSPSPLLIKGNVGMLHQVFANLLGNAIYAIGEKEGTISLKTYLNEGIAKVSISDTGIGMPKEVLDRITDPFFTTKPPGEGTGLGLSITYSIIQKHQGTISFESEVGKGTLATIELPLIT